MFVGRYYPVIEDNERLKLNAKSHIYQLPSQRCQNIRYFHTMCYREQRIYKCSHIVFADTVHPCDMNCPTRGIGFKTIYMSGIWRKV